MKFYLTHTRVLSLVQPTTIASPNRSTLVSLLAQMTSTKLGSAERNLALQLSRLIGLADSISLARGLRHLPDEVRELSLDKPALVQSYVLAERERMLNIIANSFEHEGELAAIHVPSCNAGIKADSLLMYSPFQRFYSTHQVEMAAGIEALRAKVRKDLSAFSGDMHKLAELDKIVDVSLANHTRKLFNVTPKLLETRFEQLRAEHLRGDAQRNELDEQANDQLDEQPASDDDKISHWLASDGWLKRFYDEMRELLFAEFDVRLQPVLGLLEALNEQVALQYD